MEIICKIMKQPDSRRMCEVADITITEDDITAFAETKAKKLIGWKSAEIYDISIEHIKP